MGTQRWVRLALELAVIVVLGVVLGASDVDTAVYALVMAGVVVILVGHRARRVQAGRAGPVGRGRAAAAPRGGVRP